MINIYKIFSYKLLVFAKNEEDNISLDKNKDKRNAPTVPTKFSVFNIQKLPFKVVQNQMSKSHSEFNSGFDLLIY